MGSPDSSPITRLLLRWGAGEEECLNELVPLVQRTALVGFCRKTRFQRGNSSLS